MNEIKFKQAINIKEEIAKLEKIKVVIDNKQEISFRNYQGLEQFFMNIINQEIELLNKAFNEL